jgi:hypothetical protein
MFAFLVVIVMNSANGTYRRRAIAIAVLLSTLTGGCVARNAIDATVADVKKLESTFGVISRSASPPGGIWTGAKLFSATRETFLTTTNASTCARWLAAGVRMLSA